MMPAQDMTFRNNSISPAEIENGFGRRTAINLRTVPVKAEPSLFRFKVLPVEWDNGKIEKIRKQFVVTFIPLIFGKLFQQKSVTAEEIFMGQLRIANLCILKHSAVFPQENDLRTALAIGLNSVSDPFLNHRVFPEQMTCHLLHINFSHNPTFSYLNKQS